MRRREAFLPADRALFKDQPSWEEEDRRHAAGGAHEAGNASARRAIRRRREDRRLPAMGRDARHNRRQGKAMPDRRGLDQQARPDGRATRPPSSPISRDARRSRSTGRWSNLVRSPPPRYGRRWNPGSSQHLVSKPRRTELSIEQACTFPRLRHGRPRACRLQQEAGRNDRQRAGEARADQAAAGRDWTESSMQRRPAAS